MFGNDFQENILISTHHDITKKKKIDLPVVDVVVVVGLLVDADVFVVAKIMIKI